MHPDGHVMSNWHILNQSAIPEQQEHANLPEAAAESVIINYPDSDPEYYWEPITGGEQQ